MANRAQPLDYAPRPHSRRWIVRYLLILTMVIGVVISLYLSRETIQRLHIRWLMQNCAHYSLDGQAGYTQRTTSSKASPPSPPVCWQTLAAALSARGVPLGPPRTGTGETTLFLQEMTSPDGNRWIVLVTASDATSGPSIRCTSINENLNFAAGGFNDQVIIGTNHPDMPVRISVGSVGRAGPGRVILMAQNGGAARSIDGRLQNDGSIQWVTDCGRIDNGQWQIEEASRTAPVEPDKLFKLGYDNRMDAPRALLNADGSVLVVRTMVNPQSFKDGDHLDLWDVATFQPPRWAWCGFSITKRNNSCASSPSQWRALKT